MESNESDDEPLAVLAAIKKSDPSLSAETVIESVGDWDVQPKKKKPKKTKGLEVKKPPITITLSRQVKNIAQPLVQRPQDVWLYLKEFNLVGPFSCLLCSGWFVNRSKIVIHYILNHKRDFCGICRYFVADRETWEEHSKFHIPWPCSQCFQTFPTESNLRKHLSATHKLVHCRVCHFRLPDDDQYRTHLLQKHNITNLPVEDNDVLWELEHDGSQQFICLLCNKSKNPFVTFAGHYLGYHHFTLKCLASLISGKDLPFTVLGADIRPEFVESLKDQGRCGYTDLELRSTEIEIEPNAAKEESESVLKNLLIHIKQEAISDNEEEKNVFEEKVEHETKNDEQGEQKISEEADGESQPNNVLWDSIKTYRGDEDFDVTLMELIVLEKPYFDYISQSLSDINSNIVSEISEINYDKKGDFQSEILCELCSQKFNNTIEFSTHVHKHHLVKIVPVYSCRICATTFDTCNELNSHINEELGAFEDLWLCQFCDHEFNGRPATRKHLTEHWDVIDGENCFSPHLGFKCRYCPTLFWDEKEREQHQVRVHSVNHIAEFYKCVCNEVFSDKIWFTHHYQDKHSNDSPILFKCCICAVVLTTVQDMRDHFERVHPTARKVFCSLETCCYRPLSHRKAFGQHLRFKHMPSAGSEPGGGADPARPFPCAVCARSFGSRRARSLHAAQTHGPGRFRCKLCDQTLHTLDERKLHYLINHPGQHPYECNICHKSFQYKSSLYIHKHEHAPNKQSFTCNYCQKVFAKKDSFREHLQIHEGPRHACSYCPMRFVQRSNMLRHERRHTGERPYRCPHCDRSFADKGACNAHTRSHSKDTCFACIYCGQTFVQKSKLTYHLRKHTGENLETCTVCSKVFTSGCSLRQHMKSHEEKKGRQMIACPLCDKKYREERNMLRHLRALHTGASVPCPVCHKPFSSAAGLRHHVLTHANINIFRCKICPKTYAVRRSMMKHLSNRHNLRGDSNAKDYYHKLDPRECKLNLDDETINNIFGPDKPRGEIIVNDNMTYTNANQLPKENAEENDDDDDDDEEESSDEEQGDDEKDSDEDQNMKTDDNETGDQEPLPEPDFVAVKIEPYDPDD